MEDYKRKLRNLHSSHTLACHGGVQSEIIYYESMKRKVKVKPIYECRCTGRLQTKTFTRLSHTG
jgi:hypothetical protein